MCKRTVFVIDSPTSSNLYCYLCINLPKDLRGEFINTVFDLESFELFYFNHKDEVTLRSFFADTTFISFVLFFSSLFGEDGEALSIINQIIEYIYVVHSREDNQDVISELNEERLLSYLEEILMEIKSRDEESKYRLEAKCNDLIEQLVNLGQLKYVSLSHTNEVLLHLAYDQIVKILLEWMSDEPDIEIFKNFNWTYESFNNEVDMINWQSDTMGQEIILLNDIMSSMSTIISNSSYAYEEFSKDEKNDFMNLWTLLVISGYRSILPSSFFQALKKILPNTF